MMADSQVSKGGFNFTNSVERNVSIESLVWIDDQRWTLTNIDVHCFTFLPYGDRLEIRYEGHSLGYAETSLKTDRSENDLFVKFHWIATSKVSQSQYFADTLIYAAVKLLRSGSL